MYDLCDGEVFFTYDAITQTTECLSEFVDFHEELKNICLAMDFNSEIQLSYAVYILPLFRDKKIKELLNRE